MRKSIFYVVLVLSCLFCIQCHRSISKEDLKKIQFDMDDIDAEGLESGDVAVDYEFCIPASDSTMREVLCISPGTRVMKGSKGRVGCKEGQWLCISNTRTAAWRKELYAIAALPYVDRIIQTFYE